jgi:hypothetical protein
MYRPNATPNKRTVAGALSALAVAIGAIVFTATPAKADHLEFGFFFAPPVPFPVPVVVQHEVVYDQPRVVYERPYYQPSYYAHPHRKHCRHGDGYARGGWGYSGRGDWDDDDGRYYERRDVGYRGRY